MILLVCVIPLIGKNNKNILLMKIYKFQIQISFTIEFDVYIIISLQNFIKETSLKILINQGFLEAFLPFKEDKAS